MSSADFLLYKPLQLSGAVAFSRPSPKSVYDRAGTLVQVPANTLGVTYDPADLSKAPWALIEPGAKNLVLQSDTFIANWSLPGVTVVQGAAVSPRGIMDAVKLVAQVTNGLHYAEQYPTIDASQTYTRAWFVKRAEMRFVEFAVYSRPTTSRWVRVIFDTLTGEFSSSLMAGSASHTFRAQKLNNGWWRIFQTFTLGGTDTECFFRLALLDQTTMAALFRGDGVSGVYMYGAQLTLGDREESHISTTTDPVTRAADVVGAGAGLVYSSVAITEPLWVAGTYGQGAKVRDGENFVFESLTGGNSAPLTDKTKWLPLGKTNQLKMFDKAVNSQTTAADWLTVVVKPGQLANTLTLLNISGAEVTVTQSESNYTRKRALSSHNVLSWYDFYFQEPQWIGDTVFADIPPYLNSLLTVHIKSPGNIAGLGGFFLGRPKFIGKTQWGLKAGILSYSTQEADTFGNVALLKRASAKKMNFEVAVPRGYEDEVYRFMTAADNEEMVAIASTNWAMTLSYGYLGQWELPLGIEGEKMPVEWRGLI